MDDLMLSAHDGCELAVRDHGGEGPDVVFVHGVTRTLEDWAPVLAQLPGVRAVVMDLRFHGRSGVPEDASWNDFVRDIDAVVDRLGLSNPFVVGHSFGDGLAARSLLPPGGPTAGFLVRSRCAVGDCSCRPALRSTRALRVGRR